MGRDLALLPPRLEEVRVAARLLQGVTVRTPLVPLRGSNEVLLKLEIHQPITSFKIRGVYYAVASLSRQAREKGVSTVSAGNTAQALAYAARLFGVPARCLMPEGAPRTKIEAVRALGGEPVLVSTEELFRFLKERGWEREPYVFIHPWTDRRVMIGHGSLALEIVQDCPDLESIYIPVGGGGLLAGVGYTLRALKPSVRIYAVEPAGCPSFFESRRAGKPAQVPCRTLCDGVAVPYITQEMFTLLNPLVDEVLLVSEAEVRACIRRLALENKVVVEGAGALGAAAAGRRVKPGMGPAVALVTGGSIDRDLLIGILSEDS